MPRADMRASRKPEDLHAGCLGGPHARYAVFDNQALGRSHVQTLGCKQEYIRVGFAALDHVGAKYSSGEIREKSENLKAKAQPLARA